MLYNSPKKVKEAINQIAVIEPLYRVIARDISDKDLLKLPKEKQIAWM